jgi:hypothetical protein
MAGREYYASSSARSGSSMPPIVIWTVPKYMPTLSDGRELNSDPSDGATDI